MRKMNEQTDYSKMSDKEIANAMLELSKTKNDKWFLSLLKYHRDLYEEREGEISKMKSEKKELIKTSWRDLLLDMFNEEYRKIYRDITEDQLEAFANYGLKRFAEEPSSTEDRVCARAFIELMNTKGDVQEYVNECWSKVYNDDYSLFEKEIENETIGHILRFFEKDEIEKLRFKNEYAFTIGDILYTTNVGTARAMIKELEYTLKEDYFSSKFLDFLESFEERKIK